jgi:hypothetical protein
MLNVSPRTVQNAAGLNISPATTTPHDTTRTSAVGPDHAASGPIDTTRLWAQLSQMAWTRSL